LRIAPPPKTTTTTTTTTTRASIEINYIPVAAINGLDPKCSCFNYYIRDS
jgi:hypothetical protein